MKVTRLLGALRVAVRNGAQSFRDYYQREFDPMRRDELTFAFNRPDFERRRQHLGGYALLLIDIDDFKKINDSYGHQAGDLVLCAVAGALRRASGDRVFRVGGEEFAVLLRGTDAEGAKAVAERLRKVVRGLDLLAGARVTVSIGVATSAPGERDHQAIYRRADEALYAAKRAGKDCVFAREESYPRPAAAPHSAQRQPAA